MTRREGLRRRTKAALRRFGYDIVRFPPHGSLAAHLREVFQLVDVDYVVDVGAHVGEFGQLLRADVGFRGPIISFEPVSTAFARLSRVAACDRAWHVHRLALGSESGQAMVNVTRPRVLSSLLAPAAEAFPPAEAPAVDRRESVSLSGLDDVWDQLIGGGGRRAFLKIDTQGSDLQVLEGATRSLQRVAALRAELSVQPLYRGAVPYTESLLAITRLGFELSGLFPVSRSHLRVLELDCVAIRHGLGTPAGRDED